MILAFTVLTLLYLSPNAHTAKITNCAQSNAVAKFIRAEISDCPEKEPICTFKHFNHATLKLEFKALKAIPKVIQRGSATRAGITSDFPMDNYDACKGTGLICPLKPGHAVYTYHMFINPLFPDGVYQARWELLEPSENKIVCIEFPVRILA